MGTEELELTLIDFFIKITNSDIMTFNLEEYKKSFVKVKEKAKQNQVLADFYTTTSRSKDHSNLSLEDKIILYWIPLQITSATLETVKIVLKLMLDPDTIRGANMYGQLIIRICQKLKLNDIYKEKLYDALYVNFRNSVAHDDFLIDSNGITLYGSKETHLDNTGIHNALAEVSAILKSIKIFLLIIARVTEKLQTEGHSEKFTEEVTNELEKIKKDLETQ